MYFSVGWPDVLRPRDADAGEPLVIKSCDNQALFAVLSARSLFIWTSKPRVLAAVYSRCDTSIEEHGVNCDLLWSAAGDHVAVLTSKGHLLFFHIDQGKSDVAFPVDPHFGLVSSVTLTHTNLVKVPGEVTCLGRIDGPCVVTHTEIRRYKWNASLMYGLNIPYGSGPSDESVERERYVVGMDFHPLMRGIGLVFNTGEAAFWLNPVKNKTSLAWVSGVSDARHVALNGKFRLMAVGTECGKCHVFTLEEELNELLLSHTLFLASTDYPNLHLGATKCMAWSPDGFVLAMTWKGFGLAVWSCFGALLYASVCNDHKLLPSWPMHCKLEIYSMTWLATGFQLMFLATSSHDEAPKTNGNIFQMKFVKSALTANPCFSNQKHLVLYGDKQVFLQPGESILRTRVMPPISALASRRASVASNTNFEPQGVLKSTDMPFPINLVVGPSTRSVSNSSCPSEGLRGGDVAQQQSSLQPWHTLQVPEKYIQSNWPLRYVAVNDSARHVAVAGEHGIAHCTVATQRWKVFGNISQESNITVCGGLAWWRDMIVVPCHNFADDSDEIRFYPQSSNLDNSNIALTLRVPCKIHLINLLDDCLTVVTVDKKLHMFGLRLDQTSGSSGSSMIILHSMPELSLALYVPNIEHLIALFPSEMALEAPSDHAPTPPSPLGRALPKSLVTNVAGRVLVLSRDVISGTKSSSQASVTTPYCGPVALASSVEMVWSAAHSSSCRYLQQALWLGCGASGMKVWLPLFPSTDNPQPSFLSKRVMLTFPLHIYPLAICFEDAVVIGTAQSFKEISVNSSCSASSQLFPFATMERTVQIYLHHILRSLLRRNSVVHCEEIAQSCSSLPYFAHVLELMLHEVLEEEAVKRPRDALLPAIIDFLKLFPQYLEVVGRCARKTEVALWRHLFHNVGSPEELFAECLGHNQLEMAASYLIIIQSIEAPKVSRQHATRLLNSSLEQRLWPLAKDLVRFLRTIAASSEPATPTTPHAPSFPSPTSSLHAPLGRTASAESAGNTSQGEEMTFVRPVFTTGDIQSSREEYFIDVILARHARKMLADGNLRDLGSFSAYLDFPLKAWLTKERHRVGRVENFMACFQMIHTDFEWPLPICPVEFCLARGVSLLDKAFMLRAGSASAKTSSSSVNETLSAHGFTTLSTVESQPWASLTSLMSPHISARNSVAGDAASEFGGEDDSSFTVEESTLSSISDTVRGSQQSESELRYLMSIMLSAGCFDWSLLLATVLRDSASIHCIMRVARDVALSIADVQEKKEAAVMANRILEGLGTLSKWAADRCDHFSPFLDGIIREWQAIVQLQELDEASEEAPVPVFDTDQEPEGQSDETRVHPKLSVASRDSSSSSESAGGCVIS